MKKVIFGETDGVRAAVGQSILTPEKIRIFGEAVRACGYGEATVLFGRDTRESGEWIVEGLKSAFDDGKEIDCGILTTPALAKIMAEYDNSIAFMVTASHNPASDNGVKIFEGGTKISDEKEAQIEKSYFDLKEKSLEGALEASEAKTETAEYVSDFAGKYAEIASEAPETAKFEPGQVKIVLDAACGAGHDFSRTVFEKFGVEVEQIDSAPNGQNINDGFGALYPQKMAARAAELGVPGVALDGDADRIVLADESGRIWNGDRITILLAEYLKERGLLAGDGVVLTEYSNLATVKYLESKGIKVLKVLNGDKAVSQCSMQNGLILGGELAGHILYQPWLDSSDGTFMALFVLKILQEKGAKLADLWADFVENPSYQVAVKVREKKPLEDLPEWSAACERIANEIGADGRIMTRYSGTENKLRIYVEYKDAAMAQKYGDELAAVAEKEINQ